MEEMVETIQSLNLAMIWFGVGPVLGVMLGAVLTHVAYSRGFRIGALGKDSLKKNKLPPPIQTT